MNNIRFSKKLVSLLTLAIIIGNFFPQASFAQGQQYFEQTGHWVSGIFLDYFNERGGLEIFGYPITEAFYDQGVLVQYFQKARMESHPNNPDPYKVQLGLLGDELKYRHTPVPKPQSLSRRKVYFSETGHTLAYAFLDYFKTHGSIDIFGYPITEMHFEDGKIVQYFQRMKLEWYPDDPSSTVRVGNLGELYVNIYRERMPFDVLQPQENDDARISTAPTSTPEITSLRAVVSLRYSVMSQKRNQTVSVLVTDNNGASLTNAQVTIYFETPDGQRLDGSELSLLTDARGFAQAAVPVNGGYSGSQIIVRANVSYHNGLSTTAQNVFLLWW
jgi:hypothetical protein